MLLLRPVEVQSSRHELSGAQLPQRARPGAEGARCRVASLRAMLKVPFWGPATAAEAKVACTVSPSSGTEAAASWWTTWPMQVCQSKNADFSLPRPLATHEDRYAAPTSATGQGGGPGSSSSSPLAWPNFRLQFLMQIRCESPAQKGTRCVASREAWEASTVNTPNPRPSGRQHTAVHTHTVAVLDATTAWGNT